MLPGAGRLEEDPMSQAIEELRRTVLDLTTTVSSISVRYRLCEIHERLADEGDTPSGAAPREPLTLTASTNSHLG